MGKIGINLNTGQVTKKSESLVAGIDLGTTHSLIAIVQDGEAKILKRDGCSNLIPSVIYFDENGNVVVGENAKLKMAEFPERTVFSAKRLMGKSYQDVANWSQNLGYQIIDQGADNLVKVRVDDKFYSPVELSAFILKELKTIAEEQVGQSIDKAVITVPAYFNDSQRQATKDAGKLAGIDVLRIVNEPTAASLAYGVSRISEERNIVAVYDLGGGTFDISILALEDGIFEVLSTNGDTFLGGDDIDQLIINYWIAENILADLSKIDLQELRKLAEEAKKELSQGIEVSKTFAAKELKISTKVYSELIDPLIQRTIKSCHQALLDAKVNIDEVSDVILVGGSTRIPQIKTALKSLFQKEVNDKINPDEAVAIGAAIQADILAGNRKDLLLLDITPLSLGIETVGGLMDVIIPRNSKVPGGAGRKYTTSIDGQTKLKIAIFQGERDLVSDNRKLGEFILSGIPPMSTGLPKIEIKFILDADGILQVHATEERSGVKQSIEVKPQYGITEDEMARMLLDSMQHAEKDIAIKALIEARNEGNHILSASVKFIQQNESWLTEEQITKIIGFTKNLKDKIQATDKDQIHKAIEDFNDYTSPLAHEALDKHIAANISGKSIDKLTDNG